MAKDKKAEEKPKEGGKEKPAKAPKNSMWRFQVIMAFVILGAIVFLPTTIVVMVGMIPTMVALLLNFGTAPSKVFGIGAMNLSGVAPFLVNLWKNGQSFETALNLITDPQVVTVMYLAAALGYMVNWAMMGVVGSILYESGKGRRKEIIKRQQELVERWGEEVTGRLQLDSQGFPLSEAEDSLAP